MRRLWRDEGGAILSAELILLVTMLVIGIVAGLKVLQDAINTELADVANAIGSINQSFSWYGATTGTAGATGCVSGSAGSMFGDTMDTHDNQTAANGTAASSVNVCGNTPASSLEPTAP